MGSADGYDYVKKLHSADNRQQLCVIPPLHSNTSGKFSTAAAGGKKPYTLSGVNTVWRVRDLVNGSWLLIMILQSRGWPLWFEWAVKPAGRDCPADFVSRAGGADGALATHAQLCEHGGGCFD